MCYAILKVQYHNDKEPAALIEIEKVEDLQKTILSKQEMPGVRSITTFYPGKRHKLVSEWKEESFERGEQA